MNKNVLVVIIVLLVAFAAVEGYYVNKERNEKITLSNMYVKYQREAMKPGAGGAMPGGKRPAPMMAMKGEKFDGSAVASKAYLIYPTDGEMSADAKAAMTGWSMKTVASADGSTQVDLIPNEAEDVKQTFTVKKGYKLYFLEMTLVDDKNGVDENRGDDIGILVDDKGIVQ